MVGVKTTKSMNILITICARGGSKGIPGKNIRSLNGKPLIGYTIDTAKKFAELHPGCVVELSTDSQEIRHVAASCGLLSDYIRPAEFATDGAGKLDVIYHLRDYCQEKHGKEFDYVVDLDVTSPLRNVEDLTRALRQIEEHPDALNLLSVSQPARNPYFNILEQKANGFFDVVNNEQLFLSRQSAPKVYDVNGSFYFYKREFFEQGFRAAISDKTIIYEVPHICFDMDHPIDFEFMEFLIKSARLDFEL